MQVKEIPYWMAFAHHFPEWKVAKVNALIDRFTNEEKITIEDFFHLEEAKWKNTFGLTTPDITTLVKAKAELTKLSFLAETLLNGGYEIISIQSPDYSSSLKENLRPAYAPVILYIKGNKLLLKKEAIAVVGSRGASPIALNFTENIVKNAVKESKAVISGYARGVDKKALEATIEYEGQGVIVLGQGILTFAAGFKTYYRHIVGGNVLILSTSPPELAWQIDLAMARNPVIYGLADDIYVAQSSETGGTWAGVIDGFRKKRKIYVRKADEGEKNANNLLIKKGAIAVDLNGDIIAMPPGTSPQVSLFDETN